MTNEIENINPETFPDPAAEFWRKKSEADPSISAGLNALDEYSYTPENTSAELLRLLATDPENIFDVRSTRDPQMRFYGNLPYQKNSAEVIARFHDESEYFSKHVQPNIYPEWRKQFYAEGNLTHELKFGERLSAFTKEILARYPPLEDEGKIISVFGLSGSGKSTLVHELQKKYGEKIIPMDSDTMRYNLFAKKILDAEVAGGFSLQDTQDHRVIHGAVGGALYLLAEYVRKELRDRGYTVISSSTMPDASADKIFYVQHPDGIDPQNLNSDPAIREQQLEQWSLELFLRTEKRTNGKPDDYDWTDAQTITDFRKMKPVTVTVPQNIHKYFLEQAQKELIALNESGKKITIVSNPKNKDARNAADQLMEQVQI